MHEARLWTSLEDQDVQCGLCNHFCRIKPNERGKCGVRKNIQGDLYSLVYDKVAAMNLDPIEKKPLFHFHPGSYSLSIGTVGCNFFCVFCQNDSLSQSPKTSEHIPGEEITPEQLVQAAKHHGAESISYTYSEPTIFFELLQDTAKLGKQKGLKNVLVSNGFMSEQALDELGPYVDAINVDLKSFRDDFYREYCGTRLKPVLNNLKKIKELGWWLEVTTLIIPEVNDREEELKELTEFIYKELGREVPWHISKFHPAYKMKDHYSTGMQTLENAYEIGKITGLEYIYLGNVPGHKSENTLCPTCNNLVIERQGFATNKQNLKNGHCYHCGSKISGMGLG